MGLTQAINETPTVTLVTCAAVLAALFYVSIRLVLWRLLGNSAPSKRKRNRVKKNSDKSKGKGATQQSRPAQQNSKPNDSKDSTSAGNVARSPNTTAAEQDQSDSSMNTSKPSVKKRKKNSPVSASPLSNQHAKPTTNNAATAPPSSSGTGTDDMIDREILDSAKPPKGAQSEPADKPSAPPSNNVEYVEPDEGWSQVRRQKPPRTRTEPSETTESSNMSDTELTKRQRQNRKKHEQEKQTREAAEKQRLKTLASHQRNRFEALQTS